MERSTPAPGVHIRRNALERAQAGREAETITELREHVCHIFDAVPPRRDLLRLLVPGQPVLGRSQQERLHRTAGCVSADELPRLGCEGLHGGDHLEWMPDLVKDVLEAHRPRRRPERSDLAATAIVQEAIPSRPSRSCGTSRPSRRRTNVVYLVPLRPQPVTSRRRVGPCGTGCMPSYQPERCGSLRHARPGRRSR